MTRRASASSRASNGRTATILEGEPFGYHDPRGALEIYGELAAALGLASRVQTVVGYFSRRPHPSTLERPIRQGARPEIIAVVGARLWPTFQMIFLDGDHHRESVLSDIERAARLLAPGGEVVLHDCEGGGWAVEVLAAYHPFASPPCPPLSFYLHAHRARPVDGHVSPAWSTRTNCRRRSAPRN